MNPTRSLFVVLLLLVTGPLTAAEIREVRLHRPLPEPLTSFGAAVLGEYLYVFSGHDGSAHGFGQDVLVDHFRRIKFDDPNAEWEELAKQPPSQSTALVTDGRYLYRIGGLSFLNAAEEETNFNSTDHFARYDPQTNTWEALPALPQPRSSLDAAVLGRHIYVAGGWNLQGNSSAEAPWHEDMLRFDLDQPEQGWQTLPGPGYKTRAISLAAHQDKIYLFGGITPKGITRKVSVFDPEENTWAAASELPSDSSSTGFATSSFATGGNLYVSGTSGVVYRLSEGASTWQAETRLMVPRMFLRLLPIDGERLIALGGVSPETGRVAVVESVDVGPNASHNPKLTRWSVPFDGRAKHSQMVAVLGSKLYAFGGNASRQPHDFSPEAFVNQAFEFDLGQQSVTTLPNMPIAAQSGGAVVHSLTSKHRQLLLLGGLGIDSGKFGSLDQVLSFDPKSNEWHESSAKLPAARGMFEATTYDDAIWCFGGSSSGKLDDTVAHWWGDETALAPLPNVQLPHPRRSFGGAQLGSEYFLVGGLGEGNSIVELVDVFDFEKRSWREIAPPNRHRVFAKLVSDGSRLYLFGGFSSVDGHFAAETSLEVYEPEKDKWQMVADKLPGVDGSMSMHNFAGRLLFYGIDKEKDGIANFVLLDPTPTEVPQYLPSANRPGDGNSAVLANAKTMMRKDTNKDGMLSAEELGQRLSKLIESGDADGDRLLTREELITALSKQDDET